MSTTLCVFIHKKPTTVLSPASKHLPPLVAVDPLSLSLEQEFEIFWMLLVKGSPDLREAVLQSQALQAIT